MRTVFELVIVSAIAITYYCIRSFYYNYSEVPKDDFWKVIAVLIMLIVLCLFMIFTYYKYYLKESDKSP